MKKLRRLLIIVSYIFLGIYCKLEVPIDEPVELTVEETTEEEIIEIEETNIMNDFIVKPFEEYPAYYVQGNAVSGIPADCKVPTDLMRFLPIITVDDEDLQSGFDKFFTVNGIPHFIISLQFSKEVDPGDPAEIETIVKYCTLENGAVKYLTEAKFPAMPMSERVEGETGEYTIGIDTYNGETISVAERDYNEPFIMIDGFIEIEGGLLIHTPTGRGSSRPPGLLFWPEGLRTMNHWKEPGRFWK